VRLEFSKKEKVFLKLNEPNENCTLAKSVGRGGLTNCSMTVKPDWREGAKKQKKEEKNGFSESKRIPDEKCTSGDANFVRKNILFESISAEIDVRQ
jgi:hypothetical protein